MKLISKIINSFLSKYNIDKPNLTYLVAFSGGYDSMCLLDILRKLCPKNEIIAVHLNHKWRGEESDNEEQNCKEFCEKIGVELYSESIAPDVAHTETAAREARYEFFEKCADKFDSNIIFTAHNKNDNAETLIYRICKGTGISGLRGICENRGIYYRPLLKISREEIETYCKKNNLNPNKDSSNSDINYKRNYIRAKILPELAKINSLTLETITSLSEIAAEETQIIDEYISSIMNKISIDGEIQTKKFLNLTENVQKKIIYNLFINNKLDYDRRRIISVLDFIKENSDLKSGKTLSLTDNLWLFVCDKYIKIITDQTDGLPYFHVTKEGKYENNGYVFEVEKFSKSVIKFPKDCENTAYVDLSKVEFNFEIRGRKDGDFIYPLGLNGKQKLKKYLNAKKIPNHEKERLVFMAQGSEILWAINLGISEKIKVVKNPTHRIKFYKK